MDSIGSGRPAVRPHGVVSSRRHRKGRHGTTADGGTNVVGALCKSTMAVAAAAAFVAAVVATYDWLNQPTVAVIDPWEPRPRIASPWQHPRVHPEPVVPSRQLPDVARGHAMPRGDWGTAMTTDLGRVPTMGTGITPDLPGPAPGTLAEATGVVIKPRPKPPHLMARDDRPAKRRDSHDRETVAEAKPKSAVASLGRRTVSGNGGRLILEPRTMHMLAELEQRWGERLQIRWAYRDSRLNRKVGGAKGSMHLQRKAVDIVHGGWSRAKMVRFVRLAYSIGFRGFGLGRNVVHIDTRSRFTSWNYGGNRYGSAYRMVR